MKARERAVAAFARIRQVDRPEVWITLRDEASVLAEADAVDRRAAAGGDLPLAGRLLAVKDNVDLARPPPTAGRPAVARPPTVPAPTLPRVGGARALRLRQTNPDQVP